MWMGPETGRGARSVMLIMSSSLLFICFYSSLSLFLRLRVTDAHDSRTPHEKTVNTPYLAHMYMYNHSRSCSRFSPSPLTLPYTVLYLSTLFPIIVWHNFARSKLTSSRLADFGSIIHRKRALVCYVWLCLKPQEYDCAQCAPQGLEMWGFSNTDNILTTTAFLDLF